MPKYISVPLALDLLLIAVEHVAPITKAFLPLGGDHLIQLGILLCFGISVNELAKLLNSKEKA